MKTISLELYINHKPYDVLDVYDASEDWVNAVNQAKEEFTEINTQEWFDDFTDGEFPVGTYWELKIFEY